MESPLTGKRILVTRTKRQSKEMCDRIAAYGGEAVVIPLIRFEPVVFSSDEEREWPAALEKADWLIFTSQNSVKYFAVETGIDRLRAAKRIKIAAVGKKTKAAVEACGLTVSFVPPHFTAAELLMAFKDGRLRAKRVVVPLGSLADTSWLEDLRRLGITVTDKVVYRTCPNMKARPLLIQAISERPFDAVTFASPSAVTFLTAILGEEEADRLLKKKRDCLYRHCNR
ncbi:uroporphyrinogen-III synthase [Terrilactibacillus sp. S3-3]|nr:uroporphyrinogen-III synthase [Terrilactibacillus sp. S3-3]